MKISKALLFAALLTSVGTAHAASCSNQPNNNTTSATPQAAARARANDVLRTPAPATPAAPTGTPAQRENGGGTEGGRA